ncbi:KilA-N domain-containing protein [Colletotrichum musicola]|uniref:KilA-N domain-containing protein n=1 Tax=Colletotrichum musicola TaxID=2175873 RepID=A0A8H6MKC1_9PEZI|nr:KilA-N domain-containing protein [Colletotrichum musicola]
MRSDERKRIGDFCGSVSDHFRSIMVLNYFKQRLTDTSKHYTNRNEKPTCAKVIKTIYTLAQDEEQKMGLASYKKAASNTASSSASSSSNGKTKEEKAPERCDHCDKPHDNKTCYLAHPDLVPADHKYRESILKRSREHICDNKYLRPPTCDHRSTTADIPSRASNPTDVEPAIPYRQPLSRPRVVPPPPPPTLA